MSKQRTWHAIWLLILLALSLSILGVVPHAASGYATPCSASFDFTRQLFGAPSTLSAWVQELNTGTGQVTVNGVDTQCPTIPFSFDWGDGAAAVEGWFPQQHTYTDRPRNYVVRVTSHYSGGGTDQTETVVRFTPPAIQPIALPPDRAVTIPDHPVTLTTRLYAVPSGLTYFDASFFGVVPRSTVEYVLSVAAWIQDDLTNGDVFLVDNAFNQVVLRDPSFGGMYSLWYTNPPSFASGNYGFQGAIQYSSFFHEMGHNFSLNSPADYYYGGKIDGHANAIFSESAANVYAHTTAYEILNNYPAYGLSDDLATEIKYNAIASIQVTRSGYDRYLSSGMPFHSWNDPNTPGDETFDTFMTIAYKFCAHAETAGQGYRTPAKRMMRLLQVFDPDLRARYDQYHNTPEAETFRATLMVTALSYAFSTDLRAEFRSLNFPISDETYEELLGLIPYTYHVYLPLVMREYY